MNSSDILLISYLRCNLGKYHLDGSFLVVPELVIRTGEGQNYRVNTFFFLMYPTGTVY